MNATVMTGLIIEWYLTMICSSLVNEKLNAIQRDLHTYSTFSWREYKPIIELLNVIDKWYCKLHDCINKLIPCSDRHFYCVNINKCHYWEQYFV